MFVHIGRDMIMPYHRVNIHISIAVYMLHVAVHHYARYASVITASRYQSGMHRGTNQAITLSVKLGEGSFGARPYNHVFRLYKSDLTCVSSVMNT